MKRRRREREKMTEVEQAFTDYVDALRRVEVSVKLTAYHTNRCADCVEEVCNQAKLTILHIREYLNRRKAIQARLLSLSGQVSEGRRAGMGWIRW